MTEDIELRHLRSFVAVAEELHFGRAATRLCIAQPPLSRQIKQLEEQMGVTLFERTKRKVALTEAGERFLEDARSALSHLEGGVKRARQISRGEEGWLGIGFVGSAALDVLPHALRTFRRRFPNVTLRLQEMVPSEQLQALRNQEIHIGLMQTVTSDEDLVQEPILHQPLVVALPTDHPLVRFERVPFVLLDQEPLIGYPTEPSPSCGALMASVCRVAGVLPNTVQEAQELQTVIALVAAGIGVALLPASARNLHADGVTYRDLTDDAPILVMSAVTLKNPTSPTLKSFLDILRPVVS